jgi:anti-anti-sigma regulatory factor
MKPITNRPHGYTLTLQGIADLETVQELARQLRDERAGEKEPYILVIDACALRFFAADAQAAFEELLEEALEDGLTRITVLARSTGLAGLFCDIMVRTEVMPIYQFLDLDYEDDAETEMESWLYEPFETPV